MANDQNGGFDPKLYEILAEMKSSGKADNKDLSDKVSSLQTMAAALDDKLNDLATKYAVQETVIENMKKEIISIQTIIRWAGLLVIGSVIAALLNLVLIDRTSTQNIDPMQSAQQTAYYMREEDYDDSDRGPTIHV